MNEPIRSQQDVEIAMRIFERTIKYFNIPDEPTPESAKEFFREDGTVDWDRVPTITIKKWDNGPKFLNVAYFYSGFLTVDADYYPVPAILDFLDEARKLVKNRLPDWSEDKREHQAELEAFKMTIILFSRLYPRMNLAMQNFVDETINAWFIEWRKWEAEVLSGSGIKPIPVSEIKEMRGVLKGHGDDLLKLWLDVPDKKLEEKKMQFAKEYPSILKHWQTLRTLCRAPGNDWRDYAKPEKFLDTPDDLIDKLQDSTAEKLSDLALEHAARRAGLLKVSQDEGILEQRARQIRVTGYTPRHLQNFLDEGNKLFDEMQARDSLRQDHESGEPSAEG